MSLRCEARRQSPLPDEIRSLAIRATAAHGRLNAGVRVTYPLSAAKQFGIARTSRAPPQPVTMNAPARLAALASYDVLDTPPERDFDEIAELASQVCGTPIAVVNLIGDGRQFFKAEVGLGVRETPLETSFCAKAILENDFLVVPDATKDPRFDCNPLVTGEPHLRFYAGALLKTDDGHAIGTLCVLGFEPRELTPLQERTLRVLGRQVMTQLELRKAVKASAEAVRNLSDSDERSRLAQEAGRIGTFEIDVANDVMTVSPEFCRLFGLPSSAHPTTQDTQALIVPEDRYLHSDAASRADGSADVDVEYRIERADDGRRRWIARQANFVRDANGRVVRMFGTVRDVTQRRTLQTQQAALLELGDRLREATTAEEVVGTGSEILGRTLGLSRAGYARIVARKNLFEVAGDWTAPGAASLVGRHPLSAFQQTVDRVSCGDSVVVANVEAAGWLGGDLESYSAIGTRAQIKVPLVEKGELVGLLYAHDTSPRTWSKDEVDFAHGVADRTYAALAKARAEADQRVLNRELSHRMKNTFAMVQAIATQTLRRVSDRIPVEAFMQRLLALSKAHEVLLQENFDAAGIDPVVRSVLRTFVQPDRVHVAGPDIVLGPRATMSLSLLLHELATNALKYGALSNDAGRVHVSWDLVDLDGEVELTLRWREEGGPAVSEPRSKGFGSRLIGMGLIGTGGSEIRYLASGLEAEFKAPLAQVRVS